MMISQKSRKLFTEKISEYAIIITELIKLIT